MAAWPLITGTQDKVLRIRWDQDSSHDDNFYSIRMLVCYLRRQGSQLLPAAAQALAMVSEVDLEKRVVKKFLSLQKKLREDGHLNSQNQRIISHQGQLKMQAMSQTVRNVLVPFLFRLGTRDQSSEKPKCVK